MRIVLFSSSEWLLERVSHKCWDCFVNFLGGMVLGMFCLWSFKGWPRYRTDWATSSLRSTKNVTLLRLGMAVLFRSQYFMLKWRSKKPGQGWISCIKFQASCCGLWWMNESCGSTLKVLVQDLPCFWRHWDDLPQEQPRWQPEVLFFWGGQCNMPYARLERFQSEGCNHMKIDEHRNVEVKAARSQHSRSHLK